MEKSHRYKLGIIGGDARALIAAASFKRCGYDVGLYGFANTPDSDGGAPPTVDSLCCSSSSARPHEVLHDLSMGTVSDCGTLYDNIGELLYGCEAVVLPLPASGDGENISMPLAEGMKLGIGELCAGLKKYGVPLLCGGKLNEKITKLCKEHGIEVFDYYERDEFAIANAIPTAEGALEIAMRERTATLHGSKVLVVGYGRIGKVLARSLAALGASVTVSARKASDFAWIRASGYTCVHTGELCAILAKTKYDIIFNTVPYKVLRCEELEATGIGTLIIDLASKPGGVDNDAAQRLGVKVIWALSLPGKVAPVTSGQIIADTVAGFLCERLEGV